jgi:L,D-peptidoglycan transpeptidase YkuD (ErfK/YbiS/YcfS/YnhG family)
VSRRFRVAKKQPVKRQKRAVIRLLTLSANAALGYVTIGNLRFPAAIGRGGVRALKREGDGATPLGAWRAMAVFYRPDRLKRPRTGLPVRALRPNLGWCDAPADRNYNRAVGLPYPKSHEKLWREDHLYDAIVVLDYNFTHRIGGRGSAIFMHIARPGFTPTEGCVAMTRAHLLRLLGALSNHSLLVTRNR